MACWPRLEVSKPRQQIQTEKKFPTSTTLSNEHFLPCEMLTDGVDIFPQQTLMNKHTSEGLFMAHMYIRCCSPVCQRSAAPI